MAETETTFIKGRGRLTALTLLTAAAQLEHPKQVVRAQRNGYLVPSDVAERYETLLEQIEAEENPDPEPDPEPEPEPDFEPVKRTTRKTAAAKKTAAKTTQAQE